jgi:hypothetical protein
MTLQPSLDGCLRFSLADSDDIMTRAGLIFSVLHLGIRNHRLNSSITVTDP